MSAFHFAHLKALYITMPPSSCDHGSCPPHFLPLGPYLAALTRLVEEMVRLSRNNREGGCCGFRAASKVMSEHEDCVDNEMVSLLLSTGTNLILDGDNFWMAKGLAEAIIIIQGYLDMGEKEAGSWLKWKKVRQPTEQLNTSLNMIQK